MRKLSVRVPVVFGSLFVMAEALPTEATPPPPSGEIVRAWNRLALDSVRRASAIDAEAARTYALLDVAIYDAVNGLDAARGSGGRDAALVPFTGAPAEGDLTAAAAGAAHDVMAALYPADRARFDGQRDADLAGLQGVGRVRAGRAWGEAVAARLLALRANDGSAPIESQAGAAGPGQFRASWSNVQYRNLAPFGVASAAPYLGSRPPPLDSAAYAADWLDVKTAGGAVPADTAALETYLFWSLGAGTDQPPGAWVQVALAVSDPASMDVLETARLFALLTMAMADAVAPTYATKVATHSWRPTTAIREGDTDGNDATVADPSWVARAGSAGGSPEHWSGHSAFSGAAAEALAGFFCNDGVPFTLATDSASDGVARTYPGFAAAAAEAGRSRVLGGLHFEFSNQAALDAGRRIADEILATRLLRRSGPTHAGICPL